MNTKKGPFQIHVYTDVILMRDFSLQCACRTIKTPAIYTQQTQHINSMLKWIHKNINKRVKKQFLYGQTQDSLTCFRLYCKELFPFYNLENKINILSALKNMYL